MSDQTGANGSFWVRLGDGSIQQLERLLTEEEFAQQYPGAYAAAVAARSLDRSELERD